MPTYNKKCSPNSNVNEMLKSEDCLDFAKTFRIFAVSNNE